MLNAVEARGLPVSHEVHRITSEMDASQEVIIETEWPQVIESERIAAIKISYEQSQREPNEGSSVEAERSQVAKSERLASITNTLTEPHLCYQHREQSQQERQEENPPLSTSASRLASLLYINDNASPDLLVSEEANEEEALPDNDAGQVVGEAHEPLGIINAQVNVGEIAVSHHSVRFLEPEGENGDGVVFNDGEESHEEKLPHERARTLHSIKSLDPSMSAVWGSDEEEVDEDVMQSPLPENFAEDELSHEEARTLQSIKSLDPSISAVWGPDEEEVDDDEMQSQVPPHFVSSSESISLAVHKDKKDSLGCAPVQPSRPRQSRRSLESLGSIDDYADEVLVEAEICDDDDDDDDDEAAEPILHVKLGSLNSANASQKLSMPDIYDEERRPNEVIASSLEERGNVFRDFRCL